MADPKKGKKTKKSGKRRKFAQDFLFSLKSRSQFIRLFNFYVRLNKSWKIEISGRKDFFHIRDCQGNQVVILHKERIPFYKSGIAPRVFGLLSDYMVDPDLIADGDVFLDCGANIGELGIALRLAGKSPRYVAFEPGGKEYELCALNNPDGACEKLAIWNETRTLKFYEKSDTADSSLIAFGEHEHVTEVPATTIDAYCAAHDIQEIKYLKIEAEGAEPEALEGAVEILKSTHFVTVDCGFERGVEKKSTLPEVCNHLLRNGFALVSVMPGRLVVLFENSALRPSAASGHTASDMPIPQIEESSLEDGDT